MYIHVYIYIYIYMCKSYIYIYIYMCVNQIYIYIYICKSYIYIYIYIYYISIHTNIWFYNVLLKNKCPMAYICWPACRSTLVAYAFPQNPSNRNCQKIKVCLQSRIDDMSYIWKTCCCQLLSYAKNTAITGVSKELLDQPFAPQPLATR